MHWTVGQVFPLLTRQGLVSYLLELNITHIDAMLYMPVEDEDQMGRDFVSEMPWSFFHLDINMVIVL